ncbi:hypothetical protein ACH5RR_006799 [Cinchona calisaya]|uniref:Reverse transcriptase domain-containing protein n=1 Tax=Cinchona calisaya TaxID=153742 RepID=A0ABD3AQ23_9GENT
MQGSHGLKPKSRYPGNHKSKLDFKIPFRLPLKTKDGRKKRNCDLNQTNNRSLRGKIGYSSIRSTRIRLNRLSCGIHPKNSRQLGSTSGVKGESGGGSFSEPGRQAVVDMCASLPFSKAVIVDARGFKGGLWMMWNQGEVQLDLVCKTDQAILAKIKVTPESPLWFFSAIYASPDFEVRKGLWDELKLISTSLAIPWLGQGLIIVPILLNLDSAFTPKFDKPFRMERFWMESPSFVEVVNSSWSCNNDPLNIIIPQFTKESSFLPNRRVSCNVVIVQEAVFKLRRKKGKKTFCAIKIDLEKAFDKLERDFIKVALIFFNFPDHIIKLIMSCISSSKLAVLFNAVKDVLEEFSLILGLNVNCSKSHIFLSSNIEEHEKNLIANHLGMQATQDLGKYLGFPIGVKRISKSAYRFILDKIRCIPLPKGFCREIDRQQRNFLWGDLENRNKIHLVYVGSSILMRTIVGRKFLDTCFKESREETVTFSKLKDHSQSINWKCLNKGSKLFHSGIRWLVRNGQHINFWWDDWLGIGPLRCYISGPFLHLEEKFKIKDVFNSNGDWDFSKVSIYFVILSLVF